MVVETVVDGDQRRVWIGCYQAAAAVETLVENNIGVRVCCGSGRWRREVQPDRQIKDMPDFDANALVRGEKQ